MHLAGCGTSIAIPEAKDDIHAMTCAPKNLQNLPRQPQLPAGCLAGVTANSQSIAGFNFVFLNSHREFVNFLTMADNNSVTSRIIRPFSNPGILN